VKKLSDIKSSKIAGVILSILIFATFMVVLAREPFPSSSLAHSELVPTQPGGEIGIAMSKFLWDFRGFDLTFQTLILFTTAICCLALLKEEIRR
jgi:multisubunit Na+/H+ antiporter MnhB subunit